MTSGRPIASRWPGSAQSGQASIEALAGAAALLVTGLVLLALLGAGYAAVMAEHAAEAAALALVNGRDPERAAREAVPGWPDRALDVHVRAGQARVTLFPPSPFRLLRGRLRVSADAVARPRR